MGWSVAGANSAMDEIEGFAFAFLTYETAVTQVGHEMLTCETGT